MGNCWLGVAVEVKSQSRLKSREFPRTRPVAATLEASKERRDKVQFTSSGLQ